MKIQDAKFILQAYRPNGEDANDPQFAEALKLAKKDPELAKWFAEQLAFDAAASQALKELDSPPQLRDSILAGQKIIAPSFWWKRPVSWAVAASLLLFLGLGGLWLNHEKSARFAGYLSEMTRASLATAGHVDAEINDPEKIRAWFASHQADATYTLPAGLRGAPAMGCRVLTWRGHKVSMLCYMLDGSHHVDLFVVDKNDLPDAPDQLQFVSNGVTSASWSQDGRVYVMIGPEDEAFFRKYIGVKTVARKLASPSEQL